MNAPSETLESELVRDLRELAGRFGDDQFCAELYRALTNRTLTKDGGPDGHLVLSWNRAAEFVNELRASDGKGPLPLAQSGGEGVVSETVSEVLDRHGWRTRPLNSSRHDERHSGQPDRRPPHGAGRRLS
jgi:hypothetical protein